MALEHRQTLGISVGGISNQNTQILTSEAGSSLAEAIPDSSTDLPVAFVLDLSECKSFYIKSDQALTVKTNSSSVPDDTLVLAANVGYLWQPLSIGAFVITVDIASLFVTNASGAVANLVVEELHDPTP